MKTKMMIQGAFVGVMALLATSCFNKGDYKTEYKSYISVGFEPEMEYDWADFVYEWFNAGKDTVSFFPNFRWGPVYFFAKLDDQKVFQGGTALCSGKDADASPERDPSYFAVYDGNGGNQKSHAYAVFHQTSTMPDHFIQIYLPNTESSCAAETMYVHNVQAVVQAAQHGVGLAGGPFQADDYLLLTVTGMRGTTVTGSKEVKLVDGTTFIKEWTKVDISDLGSIDTIEFKLTSSRSDFPLYCCLDDLMVHYIEIY